MKKLLPVVLGSCLISIGFIPLSNAQGTSCPSPNFNMVVNDPVVQAGMDNAWRASDEGLGTEHEEGFWIYHCRSEALQCTGDGYEYRTEIDVGKGTISSLKLPRTRQNPDCRLLGDFHTHPGVATMDPRSNDIYANERPSPGDLNSKLPGIIRFGLGRVPGAPNTTDLPYGPDMLIGPLVNPNLAWSCGTVSSVCDNVSSPVGVEDYQGTYAVFQECVIRGDTDNYWSKSYGLTITASDQVENAIILTNLYDRDPVVATVAGNSLTIARQVGTQNEDTTYAGTGTRDASGTLNATYEVTIEGNEDTGDCTSVFTPAVGVGDYLGTYVVFQECVIRGDTDNYWSKSYGLTITASDQLENAIILTNLYDLDPVVATVAGNSLTIARQVGTQTENTTYAGTGTRDPSGTLNATYEVTIEGNEDTGDCTSVFTPAGTDQAAR